MANLITKTKLLRLQDVLKIIPVSRSHWLQGVKDGIYPKPVRIGARMCAWRADEIQALIESMQEVK